MFSVKETSHAREQRITNLVQTDPAPAVVLAVVHVEWTMRRAIVALGRSPNRVVRDVLRHCHGTHHYKDVWQRDVLPRTGQRLHEIVQNWNGLLRSFRLRHRLVHGAAICSHGYAVQRVAWALAAAQDLRQYAARHGVDLDRRLAVRRGQR